MKSLWRSKPFLFKNAIQAAKLPRSAEQKEKIRNSLTGVKHSEQRKKNISEGRRGIPSWCKGTKGVMKANSGSFAKGKSAPNKGRKKVIIEGRVRYIHINKDNLNRGIS
jgi:hypothetical protein